jgi:hypothetical protein
VPRLDKRRKASNTALGVERVKGIEPSYAAWEAAVLPLNYTRDGRNSTIVSYDLDDFGLDGGSSNGDTVRDG